MQIIPESGEKLSALQLSVQFGNEAKHGGAANAKDSKLSEDMTERVSRLVETGGMKGQVPAWNSGENIQGDVDDH